MKNITLAKLDIDTKSLTNSVQKTAKEIQMLTEQQEKLLQKGKEGTQQYRANEAALKTLVLAQKAQTTVLAVQVMEEGKLVSAKKASKQISEAQTSAIVANVKSELDAYINGNREKLKDGISLSEELFEAEKTRLANTLAEENKFYDTKLQLEDERHAAEVTKHEQWKTDGIVSAQQYNKHIQILDEETAKNKSKLAIQNAQTQIGNMQTITHALGEAFGQTKELAIAQATMSAGQAILSIWAGTITSNPIIDAALKTALTASTATKTAKQIKEIQGAKKPKSPKLEKGGLMSIGGNRHSTGGTMFTGADGTHFEAEQGELIGVMNRNAARHFMAFNNAFPSSGVSAPNYLAGGGIVSREIAPQTLNMDELALKIAGANRMLPPPVVSVQDIITEGNSYVRIRDAANF